MKNPTQWTKADLHHHLQQAVDLEFWTIPLYLTALYSIKDLKNIDSRNYPDAAKLIESVVIQEMLHLEIASNICNALGHSPRFRPPTYRQDKSIPFIHPKLDSLPEEIKGFNVMIGPLDENALKLFCAIELPEPKQEIEWGAEHSYDSIGQLYQGLQRGIMCLWDECFVGEENNKKQKISFKEYQERSGRHHGFSQAVNSKEAAVKAVDAIIEQGEGADAKVVPTSFRPPEMEEDKNFDPGWFKGHLSHYQKFRILRHHHKKLPAVHSHHNSGSENEAQLKLAKCYHNFLTQMEINFNSTNPEMDNKFWDSMFGLKNAIIEVWESGAIPDFEMEAVKG